MTTITHRHSHIGSNERSSLSKGISFYSYFVLPVHLPERNPHQKVLFPVYAKSGVFLLTTTHRWVVCDGSTRSTSFPFQGCRRHVASIDFSRIPEGSACQKQCRKHWQIVLMHMGYLIAPELAQQIFITLGPEMTLQDLITHALKCSSTDINTVLRYTRGLDDSRDWTHLISRSFDLDLSESWIW